MLGLYSLPRVYPGRVGLGTTGAAEPAVGLVQMRCLEARTLSVEDISTCFWV